MFIDGRSVPDDTKIETNVCIVGAGAAGITLAREFIGTSQSVCLIEGGGLEEDDFSQDLYRGEVIGRGYPDLHVARLRYFGGTTNHWGGRNLPFEPGDLQERPWIPYSGWPFGREELDPYYRRAHEVLQLGPFEYEAEPIAAALGVPLLPLDPSVVRSVVARYNPLQFNAAYEEAIGAAPNLTCYLHSNPIFIETSHEGGAVTHLQMKTQTGNTFSVAAKYYVLASGGIENARLLLLSKNNRNNGLGNQNDLVGRFFMENLWYPSGYIVLADPGFDASLYDDAIGYYEYQGVQVQAAIRLAEDTIQREKLFTFHAEVIHRELATMVWHAAGLRSAEQIFSNAQRGRLAQPFSRHIANFIGDLGNILDDLYRGYVMEDVRTDAEMPEVLLLQNFTEQIPNPNSRVLLSSQKDALGLPRAALDWQLTGLDHRFMRRAHEIIAAEVGRAGFGRMKIQLARDETTQLPNVKGTYHHIGTTRMHHDPKQGVVDANCRVHDTSNLFLAGSSTFPTSGGSQPTLTIVALAIRLADHVKGLMQ